MTSMQIHVSLHMAPLCVKKVPLFLTTSKDFFFPSEKWPAKLSARDNSSIIHDAVALTKSVSLMHIRGWLISMMVLLTLSLICTITPSNLRSFFPILTSHLSHITSSIKAKWSYFTTIPPYGMRTLSCPSSIWHSQLFSFSCSQRKMCFFLGKFFFFSLNFSLNFSCTKCSLISW